MSSRPRRQERFATLFESVTGQSTLVERQRIDIRERCDERDEETEILSAVADGLDDAIADPEWH